MQIVTGISLDHNELVALGTSVIVESWDHKSYGKGKREWLKEFDEAEREKARYYYKLFHSWYGWRGIPQKYVFQNVMGVEFVRKMANFFATI